MNVDIQIDILTFCLIEKSTGQVVDTEMVKIKLKKSTYKGWNFNWSLPKISGYDLYALKIVDNDDIQGLIALRVEADNKAVHVDIVETAPHNIGRHGKYEGVGAHLFAYACKLAKNEGYDYIYFDAKTNLIEYYKDRLGAKQIGDTQRMFVDGDGFEKLIQTYYGGE